MHVTLLPQPDSPTMPKHLARGERERELSTAWTGPSSVSKRTERSRDIEQRLPPSARRPRVEDVA